MPWWYPFGCIAFIVGGILIFLKPEWLWALTEQWKSYAADGPSDFYILSTKIGGVLFAVFLCWRKAPLVFTIIGAAVMTAALRYIGIA